MASTSESLPAALRARLEKRGILSSKTTSESSSANGTAKESSNGKESGTESVSKAPLPPHWQRLLDPTTHVPYYWNTLTNETVWERPVFGVKDSKPNDTSDDLPPGVSAADAALANGGASSQLTFEEFAASYDNKFEDIGAALSGSSSHAAHIGNNSAASYQQWADSQQQQYYTAQYAQYYAQYGWGWPGQPQQPQQAAATPTTNTSTTTTAEPTTQPHTAPSVSKPASTVSAAPKKGEFTSNPMRYEYAKPSRDGVAIGPVRPGDVGDNPVPVAIKEVKPAPPPAPPKPVVHTIHSNCWKCGSKKDIQPDGLCMRCTSGAKPQVVASAVKVQKKQKKRPAPFQKRPVKQKKPEEEEVLDPMDPASYSECPRGNWHSGLDRDNE